MVKILATPPLDQTLDRLAAHYRGRSKFELVPIKTLLKKLGNPEKKLPPVIHIAGTNGKGSTLAFLKAMALSDKPNSVHSYTSPHLIRYNERIQLNGKPISDDIFIDSLKRVEQINRKAPVSFFEMLTATAFLVFSEHPADFLLLETGLGGRLDATNVIGAPKACLITPISFDHTKILGHTIEEIAYEKAGILKTGCQAFTVQNSRKALEVIQRRADYLNCPLHIMNQDFQCYEENNRLVYQDSTHLLDFPLPALKGRFQFQNAGLALACARFLGFKKSALQTGLKTAVWPARLQRLTLSPTLVKTRFSKQISDQDLKKLSQMEIWLDGCHNAEAARVISEAMADFEDKSPHPLILIAGLLDDKSASDWLGKFETIASELITIPIPGHPALSPDEFASLAQKQGIRARAETDFLSALFSIIKTSPSSDLNRTTSPLSTQKKAPRILITGSLYLAGYILKNYTLASK